MQDKVKSTFIALEVYPPYPNLDRRYPSYAICHPSYASYFDGIEKYGTPLPLEMNPSYASNILELKLSSYLIK